ncbi:MAG: hypothetical protein IJ969_02395 [Anaerotignum sp.]|nr:hypothetical protein [Anaerotignum sp.]MBR2851804.1 hypothetical protein [Anaerotignum sp.]
MFGRKSGMLAAMTVALLLFGGCGTDGSVDETQARNWYNEMTRENGGSAVNDTDADGYGNYTGGPNWGTENTERNTYGMRTDGGTTLGQDIRNAWDDVKNNMTGNSGSNGGNAGGNTTTGGTGGSR